MNTITVSAPGKLMLLGEHSVVSNKVVPFIRDVENAGGAAKILGGGGKKDAVGLVSCYYKMKDLARNTDKKYSYQIQPIILGEEGVRLETGRKHL